MNGHYDKDIDALAIHWGDARVEESDEVEPGVILDYDAEGNVVGVEILEATKKILQLSPEMFRPEPIPK